jgi:hypothetical protein
VTFESSHLQAVTSDYPFWQTWLSITSQGTQSTVTALHCNTCRPHAARGRSGPWMSQLLRLRPLSGRPKVLSRRDGDSLPVAMSWASVSVKVMPAVVSARSTVHIVRKQCISSEKMECITVHIVQKHDGQCILSENMQLQNMFLNKHFLA